MNRARVYVSVGSNIDRETHIRAAIEALRERYMQLTISPVYESRAIGFTGSDFYNLVVGFDTAEDVWSVADFLRHVEERRQRRRCGTRFSSRTLDMDLLLYGDMTINEDRLRLPRPEVKEYAFVLRPLADISGQRKHPVTGERYSDLWRDFDQSSQPLRPIDFQW